MIIDFKTSQGDKIDLRDLSLTSFIGNAAFSGAGGEVRFASGVLQIDKTAGGASVESEIILLGVASLTSADLLLA